MVLKANDRRTSCPCHDEFRGPRSDYVRQTLGRFLRDPDKLDLTIFSGYKLHFVSAKGPVDLRQEPEIRLNQHCFILLPHHPSFQDYDWSSCRHA
ncbi:hypothetical protein TNCV_2426541 [Trichonephila clavipes]|nr:hypothetical protein TNCV_2426541 [Trichonephila clavipes]